MPGTVTKKGNRKLVLTVGTGITHDFEKSIRGTPPVHAYVHTVSQSTVNHGKSYNT